VFTAEFQPCLTLLDNYYSLFVSRGEDHVSAQRPRLAPPAPADLANYMEVLPGPHVTSGRAGRVRHGPAIDHLLPSKPHVQLLWVLLTTSFVLRMLWLAQPDAVLIFDEKYYVNAARVILGISPDKDVYRDSVPGLDPNTEHPPLAKIVVAGSMRLLGDNPFGWRVPSVMLGTLSILLLYGIARRVGADAATGLLAAALLAFDNLVFVHSRIFTLDIFQLAFMLLGLYWYLSRRAALAGLGFALAALCKMGGVLGLVVLASYEALCLWRGSQPWQVAWRLAARRLAHTGLAFGLTFLLLLGILDWIWVGYSQPLEHLQRIVSYAAKLRRPSGPSGVESYPWQWLWNETQIPYLKVEQQVTVADEVQKTRPLILFLGAMNPYVLQLLPLGLAFAAYAWWCRRPEAELHALALAWFVGTYLPLYPATLLGHRIMYLFYILPTLPAVALAGSSFLLNAGLPRLVFWIYLAAILLGFYGYFPFKSIP
jgi:predicted membrane-bound dolichyl-phosphate-mannose-protein mannosyltransferase